MYAEYFTIPNTEELQLIITKGYLEDSWIRIYMLDIDNE